MKATDRDEGRERRVLEPGDRVVIAEGGRFGLLLGEIAERCDAEVVRVRTAWGRIVEPDAIGRALAAGRTKLVAVVHGETSTGNLQPLADIGRLVRETEALDDLEWRITARLAKKAAMPAYVQCSGRRRDGRSRSSSRSG